MLKNFLLVAWRGFKRHKAFTLINLIGLSVSMSVCLLLILLVVDQMSYDEFHPKKDQIYRILSYRNGSSSLFDGYATSPSQFKEAIKGNIPEISEITCMSRYLRGEVRSDKKVLEFKGFFADPEFFKVLGFTLKEGAEQNVLSDPFGILLSQRFADILFPDKDPVGEIVKINDRDQYIVRGVINEPEGKSHIQFDLLGSFSSLPSLVKQEKIKKTALAWESVSMNYNYLILKEGSNIIDIETNLDKIAGANMNLESDHPGFGFKLQSIESITPGIVLANEIGFTLPIFLVGFFLFLGLIVIVTATINYSNLSIAKALTRAKEVGVRKVNGATRRSIITQFLLESVLMSMASLVLAVILYQLMIQQFNGLWLFNKLGFHLEDTGNAYLYFVLFSISLGFLTGIGPAIYLSNFETVNALKGGNPNKVKRRNKYINFSGKKVMIGVQFSLALILIITITLVRDQANTLINSKYGFEEENIFFIELKGHDPDIIKTEFEGYHGVQSAALVSHNTGVGRTYGVEVTKSKGADPIDFSYFSVDENYIPLMEIEIIHGKNFQKGLSEKEESFSLINEMAAKKLGYKHPEEAIGQFLTLDDSISLKVIGVVKDYNYEVLMRDIHPLILRFIPSEYDILYLKLANSDVNSTNADLEEIWSSYDPTRDFKGGFLDYEMDLFYEVFHDLLNILTLIAALAIVITCLGLLGMVDFAIKSRIKEIGVRKVLGAEFGNVVWVLSKEFIFLIFIAILIAAPLAIFMNSLWINLMANHISFDFQNTLPGILIILLLSVGIILSKTINASKTNPVELIRDE